MRRFVFWSLILIVSGGVLSCHLLPSEYSAGTGLESKIDGVSLVNPPREIDSLQMAKLRRVNAEWVALIPFGFSKANEPEVYFNHQRWWGERLDGTAELVQLAKKNDLKVMIKPHVWLRGQWIGEYDLDSEEKWKKWEREYTQYILAFARLADSLEAPIFCVGTEYKIAAVKRPDFWKGLIKEIRSFYSGKLTYAANWDNYQNIEFWEELDYIGVDSYFPLDSNLNPDKATLNKAWMPIKKELERFSLSTNRQILFTEYGYQSFNRAAGNHWEVIEAKEELNHELQARAYESLFKTYWDEPWFAGGFFWKWHFHPEAGGLADGSFTPQGKPAEKVIARWYGKSSRSD